MALCNYRAAIKHCRNTCDSCVSYGSNSHSFSPVFGKALLRHSAKNEAEAIGAFQAALVSFELSGDKREEILFEMAAGCRILEKWSQFIHTLRQLFICVSRAKSKMLSEANIAMTKTYLEQCCTDASLDINQRAEILHEATEYSQKVDQVSMEMYRIHTQLFYFNGDKPHAYLHLESYLDGHLAECKLKCYTCQQRVRKGSVLSVARAAGSHHIAEGSTKSSHGRKSVFLIGCSVPCLDIGGWRRRNRRSIRNLVRMKIAVNVQGSSRRSLREFAVMD